MPRLSLRSTLGFTTTVVALALAAVACGSSSSGGNGGSVASSGGTVPSFCGGTAGSGSVVVGAFNFSESELLANIYAAALNKCGYSASVKALGAREVVYPALKKGTLAAVPEYAATLTDFINDANNGANAPSKASGDINKTMVALRAELPSNLVALNPATATDKNSFAVKTSFANANHITSMSQLGAYSRSHPLSLGGPAECQTRTFCEPGLKKTYGMKFSKFVTLDAGGPLTVKALKQGKVNVGLVFSSDPTVAQAGLTVLNDDKHLQASDNIVAIVQKKYATGPFANALNAVDSKLNQSTLVGLNKAVSIDHDPISEVASGFLSQVGLS
ncbi:MAG TPA: ABC transporter substrate-binding protein [Mycobacteriales bacterium]|nr:ABC transporter substrate-binding protein [Mycobacteriales bacterium]